MKTIQSIILMLTGIVCFPQLQPFTDPEFGKFEPRFLHQGFLIGNNYTENPSTGVYDVFNGIFKVNLNNGDATQFSFGESGIFGMPMGISRTSIHQDNIFIPDSGMGFRKLNLSENYIYDHLNVGGISISGAIFGNRIYFNHYLNSTYYYDLLSEKLVLLSDHPLSGILFHNMITIGDNMFALENIPVEEGQGSRLLKFDSSYVVDDFIESTLESHGDYISAFFGIVPNINISVNGRELFMAQMHTGVNRILSISPTNFQSTQFISNELNINMHPNYIILPDGIIFSMDNNYYKTDGLTTLKPMDLNVEGIFDTGGFHSPSPYNLFTESGTGNSFVQVGDVTYFNVIDNYIERIYKINSIHSTPELILSTTFENNIYQIINHAVEWNGNLLFVVQSNNSNVADKIYLYNGTKLILSPDLNDFSGRTTNEQPIVTGLFTDGELLLVNTEEGVYSIEYDEMSVSEQITITQLKIYPNPVKDILYFSEKLSEIKIYDLSGKLIKNNSAAADKLNVNDLPKGNYIITATNQSGNKFNQKFIKD